MAGSFPPNSKVNGVMLCAAASATLRPTSSDPINVMCLMTGDFVRISASVGRQQTTSREFSIHPPLENTLQHTWTSSGLNLQARRHSLIAPTNHKVDQITCSEHFKTTAFPANKAVIIGDHELCNAEAHNQRKLIEDQCAYNVR